MTRAPCSLMFAITTVSLIEGSSAALRFATALVATRGSARPLCIAFTTSALWSQSDSDVIMRNCQMRLVRAALQTASGSLRPPWLIH